MPAFIVAYDLDQPGQNYTCIIERLNTLPHCHAQESVWFVLFEGTAPDLRAYLAACLDSNDKLFVDQVSNGWAGWGMPVCGNWLNNLGL